MTKNKVKKILLLGVGNDLRGDDALGYYLIQNFNIKIFNKQLLKNKKTIINKFTTRYLDYNISEKLIKYDVVVFADASINIKSVLVYKINLNKTISSYSLSHHLTIEDILLYTKKIYNKIPNCFVICIGGYDFEYIQNISEKAKINLDLANKILYKLISYLIFKS